MPRHGSPVWLEADGHSVRITNPDKLWFPRLAVTKLDVARYYLSVAEGVLRAAGRRPVILKRYPEGADAPPFYQKRAPSPRPDWVQTATFVFPSGRRAEELVLADAAHLLWAANLGCIEVHPHPLRAGELHHPDELRIDLDPTPGVAFEDVRRVALIVRDVLGDHQLKGFPKTSGSRGMHVYVRIEPRWEFRQVRRAALAVARAVVERAPALASDRWWKRERHGVFVDFNQNARDRTIAAAWSLRATADARVSMPLFWDEVPSCDPAAFTIHTAPRRLAERGDPAARIDDTAYGLDSLLEEAARQERKGAGEPPYPPYHPRPTP
jgi:bifunctional non-homologous end joining protein LigD